MAKKNLIADKVLIAAQKDAEQALKLLESEQADEIIGAPPKDYGVLVKGVRGAYTMLMTMAASNGMAVNDETLKMGSQAELVLLTLLHYAYALGTQHGDARSGK